jgi:hypothetical protein
MAADTLEDRQHVHQLIEQLGPEQIDAVARLLEVMVDPVSRALAAAPSDDEPVTEQDRRRFQDGQAWFANRGGKGRSMDDVVVSAGIKPEDLR